MARTKTVRGSTRMVRKGSNKTGRGFKAVKSYRKKR